MGQDQSNYEISPERDAKELGRLAENTKDMSKSSAYKVASEGVTFTKLLEGLRGDKLVKKPKNKQWWKK